MDAMDRYIERLNDPEVRAFNRKLHRVDEDDPAPEVSIVSEDNVDVAEEALGVPLPPSYRKLVTSVRQHDAEYGLLWVWDGMSLMSDIVTDHQSELNIRPPFLIAVVDHENGNADCFDTRRRDERGEYPIVHFDHEMHDSSSTDFEIVAGNLGEYLLDWLDLRANDSSK